MERANRVIGHLGTVLLPQAKALEVASKKKRLPHFGTDFAGDSRSDAEKSAVLVDRYATLLGKSYRDNSVRLKMTDLMVQLGVPTLEESYQIQHKSIAIAQANSGVALNLVGWKLGPRFFGPLFDSLVVRQKKPGDLLSFSVGGRKMRGVEGESALQITRDFPARNNGEPEYSLAEVNAACGDLAVAIEILGTRYNGEGKWTLSMITADFGHCVGLALGVPYKNWRQDLDITQLYGVTSLNGEVIGQGGSSKLFKGGQMEALHYHVNNFTSHGVSLKAGQWFSTGSVTGLSRDIVAGDRVELDWGVLGKITLLFTE